MNLLELEYYNNIITIANFIIQYKSYKSHKGHIFEFESYRSFTWPNLAGTIFWESLVLKFDYNVRKIIY